MQTKASQSKTWSKTNVANLYVHRDDIYYYRVTVGGKQIWESLRTKLKSAAEARVAEKQNSVRAFRRRISSARSGNMTIGQAIEQALLEIDQNPDLKLSTKHFRHQASLALLNHHKRQRH